jgi:quercetin dioxygenase-like cupin family protein
MQANTILTGIGTTPQAERRLSVRLRTAAFALMAVAAVVGLAVPPAAAQAVLAIRALGEKRVTQLPAGPLVWRLETFPTTAAARVAEGPTGLVAESTGRVWLFTLGPTGGSSPGGTKVAEVGPVPIAPASAYLLRINESSGPAGSVTTVHTHPGSEAFYVLSGEQSLRTAAGVIRTAAGGTEIGPGGGTPLQVASSGTTDLRALIMFVVDADKPFSSPAAFPAAAPAQMPQVLPRTGGVSPPMVPAWLALLVGGGILGGVAGSRVARRLRGRR